MPSDHEASIDLDRRISIASEVLRAEALEREQSARSKARVAAAESEQAYRRRVVRGAQPKRVPRIVRIAALLSTLGLLADVGAALASIRMFGGAATTTGVQQVYLAIAVCLLSASVRCPFVWMGVTGSSRWKSRARFQMSALLFLNGIAFGVLILALLAGKMKSAAIVPLAAAAIARFAWLSLWYWLLVQRTPDTVED